MYKRYTATSHQKTNKHVARPRQTITENAPYKEQHVQCNPIIDHNSNIPKKLVIATVHKEWISNTFMSIIILLQLK